MKFSKKILFILICTLSTANLLAQNVFIPDANFKSALVNNPSINTNNDSEIQISEANAYSSSLSINNLNISDLTGISEFYNITDLYCTGNNITSLDVSNFSSLLMIYCDTNQITTINISNCSALLSLICNNNIITNIIFNNNTSLQTLLCYNNQLSSLNMTNCPALLTVHCSNNLLTTLNLSNNNALGYLNCSSNLLATLVVSNCVALTNLYCANNLFTTLNLSNNNALSYLYCVSNQLSNLDISLNTILSTLNCQNNPNLSCIKVANVAVANAQTNWYKPAQASYSQFCLNGVIPVPVNAPSQINLLLSNLNTGQNASILGNDFTPNSSIHLLVKNNLGQTILDSSLISNSIGKITCQWVIPNSVTTGTYYLTAFDAQKNYTTSPARILQVTNNTNPIVQQYITIQNPIASNIYQQGDNILVSFSDKITTAINPDVNGLITKQYNIDFRINNGTWQSQNTVTKKGLYNNWITVNSQFIAPSDGNYEVRVQEVNNLLNEEITPVFVVTPPINLGIDISTYWDYSSPLPTISFPTAVSADGTARMYISVSKKAGNSNTIQQVKITAEDNALPNQTVNYVGKIKGAIVCNAYTEEANNLTQNTDILTAPNFGASYYFWYVAPDDFDRGLLGVNSDKYSGRRTVKLKVETTYAGITNPEISFYEIDIVRPPIMFVHGLGGDEHTWDNLQYTKGLSGNKHFIASTSVFQAGIQVNNMYKGAPFIQNAQVLLGFDITKTENSFQNLLNEAHNKGICANRVDYVCHSMGGSMIRTVINKYPNLYRPSVSSNASFKNYSGGFVNKLITLNTPHNGSTGADFLYEAIPNVTENYALVIHSKFDKDGMTGTYLNESSQVVTNGIGFSYQKYSYTASDAVKDLQYFNPDPMDGGVRFQKTLGVKNHLIAGLVADNPIDANNYLLIPSIALNIAELIKGVVKNDLIVNGLTAPTPNDLRVTLNSIMSNYGNPTFCENSDMVVPLQSELAGNSGTNIASNMSLYYGEDAMHLNIHGRLDVGNKVFDLLNTNISNSLFADDIDANNIGGGLQYKKTRTQTSDSTFEYFDTTKISIIAPTLNSTYYVDSLINIVVKLNDTLNLKMVQVVFQGNMYNSILKDSLQAFQIKINPSFIDSQNVIVSALYDSLGFKIYRHNVTKVLINTLGIASKLIITPHTKLLNPNEEYVARLNCTYPSYVVEVNQSNPNVSITVADTNVIKFNLNNKRFVAKDSGSTYAVIEYVGLKDTIYFKVTGMDNTIFTPLNFQEYQTNLNAQFNVYPNPTNRQFFIEPIDNINIITNISIYDLTGKKVNEIPSYTINKQNQKGISTSGLSSGVYFVSFVTNNKKYATKIVVK